MHRVQDIVDIDPRVRIVGSLLGQSRSRRRGSSQDVVGSRLYVPGDDMRRIDWAATARLTAAVGEERFVVREYYAEESPTVVVAVDRAASMALYPSWLPWLHKPEAVANCVAAIRASAVHHRSLVTLASSTTELLDQPQPDALASEREQPLAAVADDAGRRDWLSPLLLGGRRWLPPGTLVFVLSDFLRGLDDDLLRLALDYEWELVPIVLRDERWERSFPVAAGGMTLPLADEHGRLAPRRVSAREAERRREENERSWQELLHVLRETGFPPVQVGDASMEGVVAAFVEWSFERDSVVLA